MKPAPADMDGGYGWFVVLSSFLIHFLALGLVYSFGLYLLPIADTFNTGRGAAAWVGSTQVGIMLITSVFVGKFVHRFGCRRVTWVGAVLIITGLIISSYATALWHLIVFYGMVGGVGLSCCFVPAVSSVQTWFDRRRGLATGMAVAGSGLGNFVFPQLKRLALDSYRWQIVMRWEGAFVGALVVLASAFLKLRPLDTYDDEEEDEPAAPPPPQSIELTQVNKPTTTTTTQAPPPKTSLRRAASQRHLTLGDIKHSRAFRLLIVANFIGSFGYGTPFFHVVAMAEDEGVSEADSALILSMFGISSLCGRIILGAVADRVGDVRTLMSSTFIMGVMSIMWPLLFKTFPLLMMYACVYGFNAGAFISLPPTVTANFFGTTFISQLVGYLYTANALPASIGPFAAGVTYDEYGDYVVAGFLTGVPLLASVCFWAFLPPPDTYMMTPPPKKKKESSVPAAVIANTSSTADVVVLPVENTESTTTPTRF